jgi:hypothetical protein
MKLLHDEQLLFFVGRIKMKEFKEIAFNTSLFIGGIIIFKYIIEFIGTFICP